jgi:bifunctional non-homologous end joining protein LigD
MHARLDAGRVQILTRRGNYWTDKYPAIAEAIAKLPARNAYLDGELCGVLPDGRTAFNLIQNATDTGEGSLVFFFFDLLFLDGENLTALPLVERSSIGWPANTVWRALSRSDAIPDLVIVVP